MKVEINYRIIRMLIVATIVMLTSIFIIRVLGDGKIIHKFSFKKDIVVIKEQEFNYNILNIYGDVYVRGKVVGNIATINSDIYVDGEVHGNIITIFGKIHKGVDSKIYGRELGISEEKRNCLIQNRILDSNQFLYIVFGIISCLSLYFIDKKFRIREATNLSKNIHLRLKFGYIIEISGFILLIVLGLSLLGIQFAPAIALIPVVFISMFFMYLIGFISLMIYIGMKINYSITKNIPYPIYISFFIVLYSFIRNIPYISEFIGFVILIPLSIGNIYVEYFHNCLNNMECNENEKNI